MLRRRRFLVAAILAILLSIVLPITVLAISTFTITVANTTGSAYTNKPVRINVNNAALASGGFTSSSQLDVLIRTISGTAQPHMPATDKSMFIASTLAPNSSTQFVWSSGNSPKSSHEIVVGTDGYATTLDDAALEPLDSFQLTISGLFSMSGSGDIFKKLNSLRLSYSGTALTLKAGNNAAPDHTLTATMAAGSHVVRVSAESDAVVPEDLGDLGAAIIDTETRADWSFEFSLYPLDVQGVWAVMHTDSGHTDITTYTINPTTGAIDYVDNETISEIPVSDTSALVHIDGDIYALVGTRWPTNSVYVETFDIEDNGVINDGGVASVSDAETGIGDFTDLPIIVGDTGTAKIIAFATSYNIFTYSINYAGTVITKIDKESTGGSNLGAARMVSVDGTVYAGIVSTDGTPPTVFTKNITSGGAITAIDSAAVDGDNVTAGAGGVGRVSNIVKIRDTTFLVYFYDAGSSTPTLKTISIAANGTIGSVLDTDPSANYAMGCTSPIVWLGDYVYMLPTDPIRTITIGLDGTIGAIIDSIDTSTVGGEIAYIVGMVSDPGPTTVFVSLIVQDTVTSFKLKSFNGVAMDGWGEFTKLKLFVDDMATEVDSETLTAPLVDNASDWVWYPNPYLNYVTLETSN